MEAWHVAALSRAKKLPSLKSLLRSKSTQRAVSPQEQRLFFIDFARRAGLKIERHAKPVVQYPAVK